MLNITTTQTKPENIRIRTPPWRATAAIHKNERNHSKKNGRRDRFLIKISSTPVDSLANRYNIDIADALIPILLKIGCIKPVAAQLYYR